MTKSATNYIPGTHPDLPPPTSTGGIVGWCRKNLFSSIPNTIATLVIIWIGVQIIPSLFSWLFIDSIFVANNSRECFDSKQGGGCFGFVAKRFGQFIYGFYPVEQRWRIDVAFILLLICLYGILFDTAKFRKQILVFSIIYPIIGFLLVKGDGYMFESIRTSKLGGMALNIMIGVVGIGASLPIGVLLALGRRSKMIFFRVLSVCFIEFFRGVPLITLLFVAATMLSYFLPPGTHFDLLLKVMIMVTMFAAAYLAEVVRGGLQAIPKGQFEAAEAMGLTYWQTMRFIILPQALKISIPGIVNTFIGLFKDTTLVIIISMFDILGVGLAALQDVTWKGTHREMYLFIGIFFFICCFSMSRYSLWLEKKLHTGH